MNKVVKGDSAYLAYSVLKDAILYLHLSPGQVIDEPYLTNLFNFSKTPITEALTSLVAEGLVESRKGCNAVVASLTRRHCMEYIESYKSLSIAISHFAALRVTDSSIRDLREAEKNYRQASAVNNHRARIQASLEFHERMAYSTKNNYLIGFYSNLLNHRARLESFFYLYVVGSRSESDMYLREDLRYHVELLRALETFCPETVKQVVFKYLRVSTSRLKSNPFLNELSIRGDRSVKITSLFLLFYTLFIDFIIK